jgi:hypothetical protein
MRSVKWKSSNLLMKYVTKSSDWVAEPVQLLYRQ